MVGKTERFEMRLDEETLEKIDVWRGRQPGLPSRAEAIRRLVDSGLAMEPKEGVNLSDGEKVLISMLTDLSKHLKVRGETDTDFINKAIFGGHYWALRWRMPGLFHDDADEPQDLKFVLEILEMWDSIERAFGNLPAKEKSRVKKENPLGDHIRFTGFDGNHKYESGLMGIAHFLVNDMERFQAFKGRDLNSHMPITDAYRRMLDVYAPIRNEFRGVDLNADQILAILRAFPYQKRAENV